MAQYRERGTGLLRAREASTFDNEDDFDLSLRNVEEDGLQALFARHDSGCSLVKKSTATDYGLNCTTQCSTVCKKTDKGGCKASPKGSEFACDQCQCKKS